VAVKIREELASRDVFAVNIISSPGAGKTSLLERIGPLLKEGGVPFLVITGDCFTSRDAERIDRLDLPVIQITTGGACHMNAQIVRKALKGYDLDSIDLLIIENVGNLVCPADFDLGEDMKIALFSTAEGEDKPIKYPALVKESDLAIINKTDLIGHVDFDLDFCEKSIKRIKPGIGLIRTSCKTGEGIPDVVDWMEQHIKIKKERNS